MLRCSSPIISLPTEGWTQVILSNHVPDLPHIVAGLGLGDHIKVNAILERAARFPERDEAVEQVNDRVRPALQVVVHRGGVAGVALPVASELSSGGGELTKPIAPAV